MFFYIISSFVFRSCLIFLIKSKYFSLKLHKHIFQFIVKTQQNFRLCISVPDCTQVHILISRSLCFIVKAEMSWWRRGGLSINFNVRCESNFRKLWLHQAKVETTHCFISLHLLSNNFRSQTVYCGQYLCIFLFVVLSQHAVSGCDHSWLSSGCIRSRVTNSLLTRCILYPLTLMAHLLFCIV